MAITHLRKAILLFFLVGCHGFLAAQVVGYTSVKLINDADGSGAASINDTLLYTFTFLNRGTTDITNFQITADLGTMLIRGGTLTAFASSGANLAINSTYNGTTMPTILQSGVLLKANNGFVKIELPVRVLDAAGSQTIAFQPIGSGDALANVPTDAIDSHSTANQCDPPADVSVQLGSITQTCTTGLDPTLVTIPAGFYDLQGYLSVALANDIDADGVPSIGDTLTYTLTYLNEGNLTVNNFAIEQALPAGLQIRARTLVGSVGATLALNSSYNGTTNIALLSTGAVLPANGYVTIVSKVLVTSSAGGMTLSVQASASGTNVAATLSDAIDDAPLINACDPPATIAAPTGSLVQTCSTGKDATIVSVAAGIARLEGYLSVQLAADMDGNAVASIGDTLTYTLIYKNTGTVNAENFSLTFPLPNGLSYISRSTLATTGSTISTNSTYNGTTVNTLLQANNMLIAGGRITVTLKVLVTAAAGNQTLSAQATGSGSNVSTTLSDAIDNSVTTNACDPPAGITPAATTIDQTCDSGLNPVVISIPPGAVAVNGYLSVGIKTDTDGSGTPTVGDKLVYTLIYRNIGTTDITNFNINLTLPACLTRTDTTFLTKNSTTTVGLNSAYNGTTTTLLFRADSTLTAGGVVKITLPLLVQTCAENQTLSLQGMATGTGLSSTLSEAVYVNGNVSCGIPSPDSIPANSLLQDCTNALDATKVSISTSLPVQWLQFTGELVGKSVHLRWQTAQEENNSKFVIERSLDGIAFEAIGWVAGKGTTTSLSSYEFTDIRPYATDNYYRLRQVDTDLKSSYSTVIKVSAGDEKTAGIVAFPNPARQHFDLIGMQLKEGDYQLEIVNAAGMILHSAPLAVRFQQALLPLSLTQPLPTGLYYLVLQHVASAARYTTPLVIQE